MFFHCFKKAFLKVCRNSYNMGIVNRAHHQVGNGRLFSHAPDIPLRRKLFWWNKENIEDVIRGTKA